MAKDVIKRKSGGADGGRKESGGKIANNGGNGKDEVKKPQSWVHKMVTRSIVGTAMMVFFYIIIATKPFIIIPCFVLGLQVVGFNEVISIRHKEMKEVDLILFRTQCWFWAWIFLFGMYARGAAQSVQRLIPDLFPENVLEVFLHYHLWITFSLGIIAFIAFVMTLRKGRYKYQFTQFSWTLMTIVILLGNLYVVNANMKNGLFWFVFPSSLIICNDCMAYFCGMALGGKITSRQFIQLSPNKTWEGFIGAFFCTLLFAWMASKYLAQYPWLYCPEEDLRYGAVSCDTPQFFLPKTYTLPDTVENIMESLGLPTVGSFTILPAQLHSLFLATFASLIAPFGGFFASGMKRAYGVKDFGAYFPGHGGVFDRMDCQWLMHLCTYVHMVTFVLPRYGGVPQILKLISELPVQRQLQVLEVLQKRLHGA